MVKGQERRLINYTLFENPSMAMNFKPTSISGGTRDTNSYRGRDRSTVGRGNSPNHVCIHCGRINHTVKTCFLKHGYPLGYHYKSSKSSINITTASTSDDTPSNPSYNSHQTLATIQDQYIEILQLLQHHRISYISPIMTNNALPHINFVSTLMDGKTLVY